MIFAFLFYTLFYTGQLHRYYIIRNNESKSNTVHLTLEGDPNQICRIKLFSKNDTQYFYKDVNCGYDTICMVACSGEYTFHTGSVASHHYLQISSQTKTDYLKVSHSTFLNKQYLNLKLRLATSTIPLSKYHFDSRSVMFRTIFNCDDSSTSCNLCDIRSGQFVIKTYSANSKPSHGDEYLLRAFYHLYDKPIEIFCGPHNPKIHFNKNILLIKKQNILKRYPVRISSNTSQSKIDIKFDEPLLDTICKFEITKKGGALISNCEVSNDNNNCYQICQDVTMTLNHDVNDKIFDVKISTRGAETEKLTMSTEKNDFIIKDIGQFGATLELSTLHSSNSQCKVQLFSQTNYVEINGNNIGLQAHTSFGLCQNDITLVKLDPDTKYVVNIQYKSSPSDTDVLHINKLFRTAKLDPFLPQFTIYPENVVIVPQPTKNEGYETECMILQKQTDSDPFSPSVCEESHNCVGLCTSVFTVGELAVGTEYTFKVVPLRLYASSQEMAKKVQTESLFKSVMIGYKWQENDLEISANAGALQGGICDIKVVEKINENLTKVLAIHDRTNGWNASCNSKLTFFDVPEYKNATVIVQRRYDGELAELDLFVAVVDLEESRNVPNPTHAH